MKRENPKEYLLSLYMKKQEIIDRLENYRLQKKDYSSRHSKVNMNRMSVMVELGSEPSGKGKNAEDTFGMKDEDWDVYRGINKVNVNEEEEEDNNLLNEVETQIIEFDKGGHLSRIRKEQRKRVFKVKQPQRSSLGRGSVQMCRVNFPA